MTTSDHRAGSWKVTTGSLPPGLSLTGFTISGIPTTPGNFPITLQFTDTAKQTASVVTAISVVGTSPAPAGDVYAWGTNPCGGLGDGTATNSFTPENVANLNGMKEISVAYTDFRSGTTWEVYGLRSDGTVWGWGTCGVKVDSLSPVQIPGLEHIADLQVSAGPTNYALASDGTVWAWGFNDGGGFGNGAPLDAQATTAFQIPGLAHVTQLLGLGEGGYAVESDGSVWGWGTVDVGAPADPGTGAFPIQSTPIRVSGLSGVRSLSLYDQGANYALKTDGTLWAWGDNTWGELGTGSSNTSDSAPISNPVQVTGLHDVVAVKHGIQENYAFESDGSLWVWGTIRQAGDDGIAGSLALPAHQSPVCSRSRGLRQISPAGPGRPHA